MKTRSPDQKDENESSNDSAGLMACANDLMEGIRQNDAKKVAEAMRAAFEIMESEPHEEAEHEEGE